MRVSKESERVVKAVFNGHHRPIELNFAESRGCIESVEVGQ